MELCTTQAIASVPNQRRLFSAATSHLRSKAALPLGKSQRFSWGLSSQLVLSTKVGATSEEMSSGPSSYVGEERDGVITVEDVPPIEKNTYGENVPEQPSQEDPSTNGQLQAFDILDNLNIKFDVNDAPSILLYGTGALVAVWLTSAVVGAVDSIPVFPKLMEVVGLGYTLWFSWRYLIFKRNRDELAAKIDELKQQVLGSKDD